jgi:hypothetical protein
MIERIRKSFYNGVKQIKLFASFFAERTKVETSAVKQFFLSNRMELKLEELYGNIGRRVVEIQESGAGSILENPEVVRLIEEARTVKKEIDEYKSSLHEAEKLSG